LSPAVERAVERVEKRIARELERFPGPAKRRRVRWQASTADPS
jgi:hypothetical protein